MRSLSREIMALVCLLLWPALAVGAQAAAGEPGPYQIVVLSVGAARRQNLMRADPRWSPLRLLAGRPAAGRGPRRFAIDGKTYFYAVFLDRSGRLAGRRVVFTWYYRSRPKLYGIPAARLALRRPGRPWPSASACIWSQPPASAGLLGGLGFGGVGDRAAWEKSRCYGPRLVKVWTLRGYRTGPGGRRVPIPGRPLAQARFEIHRQGAVLY